MANWETRSGGKGFLTKFLVGKANYFWDSLDFKAFEDILAQNLICRYGIPDRIITDNGTNLNNTIHHSV